MPSESEPHSAQYFGDFRDFWWNRDFLELMARRWRLGEVESVLDIGCGVGHWGRILAEVLPPKSAIVGIDREQAWVDEATKRVSGEESARFRYELADVASIPYPDDTFDLVTCQTVLIHVADPVVIVREMLRVTKPGGLVVAAEPNNRASALVVTSLTAENDIEETVKYVRFQLVCERGKRMLGEGDLSVGDLLPGLFVEAGARDIQVHLSDKTSSVFPPYAGPEQQTLIEHTRGMIEKQLWVWDRAQSERYFVAGGGEPSEFDRLWEFVNINDGSFDAAIRNKTYHTGGGALMYLVAGRKPPVDARQP